METPSASSFRPALPERPKSSRRAKGEGGFTYVAAKGLWKLEVPLPPGQDGKRRKRAVYGKTKEDVKRKLTDLTARGGGTLQAVNPTRLSDYATTWLAGVEKRLEPKTYESYEWAWRKYAHPLIGGVKLEKVTRAMVKDFIAKLAAGGSSANTIRHVVRVMHTLFADAIEDDVFAGANPFANLRKAKPTHEPEDARLLTADEIARFVTAARDDRLEAAWLLGLCNGLRIGEMFGLTWADIDFENAVVHVLRQAQSVKKKQATAKRLNPAKKLKTLGSKRRIYPDAEVMMALVRRREAASQESPSRFVFASTTNPNTPMTPNNARRRNFADIVKAAKLTGHVTPHDLRHTFNTIGAQEGVPVKVRGGMMGQDSLVATAMYEHSDEVQERAGSRVIGAAIFKTTRQVK